MFLAYERAGDHVRDRRLYENAAQHYTLALETPKVSEIDRTRIEEKLAHALFHGPNPESADSWIESILNRYPDDLANPEKIVKWLFQKSSYLWANAKIEAAIPVLTRALRLAEAAQDVHLIKSAHLRLTGVLRNAGQYELAAAHFAAIGKIKETDDATFRSIYYRTSAFISARRGRAADAYRDFELALDAAKEIGDEEILGSVWSDYARWAAALGDINRAKTCIERSLFVARGNHVIWATPFLGLIYAHILAKTGQFRRAKKYVSQTMASGAGSPMIDMVFCEAGIPIALHVKDEALLAQCANSKSLLRALESGSPDIAAPVVAAFAQLYVSQGRFRKARQLLNRVLPTIHHVDQNWDFTVAVACHGFYRDIPAARKLLEMRAELPSNEVASAYLSLFDAYVSRRRKRLSLTLVHAKEAIHRFEKLQWYAYADQARFLLPNSDVLQGSVPQNALPIHIHSNLTAREHDVARLVVKEYTNRAIAQKLAISEKTVETHIASIMNRLGIRSRYQLEEALPEEGSQGFPDVKR
jgi:DNA-binding CsgD family transcriptional regulator